MRFDIDGNTIFIETSKYKAILKGPQITLLMDKDGNKLVDMQGLEVDEYLQVIDISGKSYKIEEGSNLQMEIVPMGIGCAEIFISEWQYDAVVRVEVDTETEDLMITPSVATLKKGISAVRWNICGIGKELELIAPVYQGIRLGLEDELISGDRWQWPSTWEAGLAIMQGKNSGFYVHCRDTQFKYKALNIGGEITKHCLGFDVENYGPAYESQACGGLTWRVNVHGKEWESAAEVYRSWLWMAYPLKKAVSSKPEWMNDISLAVCWCPCDIELLKALAQKHPAGKTLLHIPDWRIDGYDENYPTYKASRDGAAFIAAAKEMGFKVMPHFNYFGVDPSHPSFNTLLPFIYRHPVTGSLWGWGWDEKKGDIGIPQSGTQIKKHKELKTLAYVHPGLSWWRAYLRQNIMGAAKELDVDIVFADQTGGTLNVQNCLVENITPTEGMMRFTREVACAGLGIAGEGLNEISMQWQSFAQAHLFKSPHSTIKGLERAVYPVNAYLFKGVCKTIGYSGLHGMDETSALRMEAHAVQKAIPTLTVQNAEQILKPNEAVKKELERAFEYDS